MSDTLDKVTSRIQASADATSQPSIASLFDTMKSGFDSFLAVGMKQTKQAEQLTQATAEQIKSNQELIKNMDKLTRAVVTSSRTEKAEKDARFYTGQKDYQIANPATQLLQAIGSKLNSRDILNSLGLVNKGSGSIMDQLLEKRQARNEFVADAKKYGDGDKSTSELKKDFNKISKLSAQLKAQTEKIDELRSKGFSDAQIEKGGHISDRNMTVDKLKEIDPRAAARDGEAALHKRGPYAKSGSSDGMSQDLKEYMYDITTILANIEKGLHVGDNQPTQKTVQGQQQVKPELDDHNKNLLNKITEGMQKVNLTPADLKPAATGTPAQPVSAPWTPIVGTSIKADDAELVKEKEGENPLIAVIEKGNAKLLEALKDVSSELKVLIAEESSHAGGLMESLAGLGASLASSLGGGLKTIGNLVAKAGRLTGPAAAVLGAGAAGYAVGTLINDKITDMLGEPLGAYIYDKTHDPQVQQTKKVSSINYDEMGNPINTSEDADDTPNVKTKPQLAPPNLNRAATIRSESMNEKKEQSAPIIVAPKAAPVTNITNNNTTSGGSSSPRNGDSTLMDYIASRYNFN